MFSYISTAKDRLYRASSNELFYHYGKNLLFLYALISGLSIAASQIFLSVLVVLWLGNLYWHNSLEQFENGSLHYLSTPIIIWFCLALFSSVFGVDIPNSLNETLKTGLHFCLPFAIYTIWQLGPTDENAKQNFEKDNSKFLSLFAISLSIAAIHSVFSSFFGYEIPIKIPGAVTESGQLALVIPVTLAMILGRDPSSLKSSHIILAILLFILSLITAWPEAFSIPDGICLSLLTLGIAATIYFCVLKPFPELGKFCLLLSLLLVGLVVNLKRGPWMGVFVAISALGLIISRKLIVYSSIIVLAAFTFINPVQERALSMIEHFQIEGGRSEIWSLGYELANRYPLGVGPDNAKIIRELDPELPEMHRHMHNNLLNIVVETGWLGLIIFCLWFYRIFRFSWHVWQKSKNSAKRNVAIQLLGLSAGFLAWQTAGLVEYNFGDGEVRLIALSLFGLILTHVKYFEKELVDFFPSKTQTN